LESNDELSVRPLHSKVIMETDMWSIYSKLLIWNVWEMGCADYINLPVTWRNLLQNPNFTHFHPFTLFQYFHFSF
jgi:hypothetical protein